MPTGGEDLQRVHEVIELQPKDSDATWAAVL